MKWVCLMANMTIPGAGSMIAKRYGAGAIQVVGSLIGFALFGYCIMEFYDAMKAYSDSMEGEPEDMVAAFKGISGKIKGPLIYGAVGVLSLKITWIWAQVTTAQVFKAEKKAEAAERGAETQAVPPLLDSSN